MFLADGIKVGLGTDVAGGHSASMLDCMRQSLVASRVVGFSHRDHGASTKSLEDEEVQHPPMTYQEIFHLATVGGAEALGMGKVLGNFEPGKQLDCLVVNTNDDPGNPFDV